MEFLLVFIMLVFNYHFNNSKKKNGSKRFNGNDLWYLRSNSITGIDDVRHYAIEGVLNYFAFFLLLNTMIPISIIVSLEVVKYIQAFMIELD